MGRYSGKTCRLSTMLMLTASFFLVEIIVGYVTNSIALVADSFHMLSDVVALIVGFASVRISKWPSKRNTYGWVRAEILGALVNAVFLLALCFSIIVEALKRLVEVEKVDNPKLLLIVGGAGLLVNVIGLFLFGGHGHSHGGHGHSHGGHGHSHSKVPPQAGDGSAYKDMANGSAMKTTEDEALVPLEKGSTSTSTDDKEIYVSPNSNITIEIKKPKITPPGEKDTPATSTQLNMKGVFLHVLGDALGSVVVVVSALVIWFAEGDWKYYVDPAMSIIMVIIILTTTIPLLKESAFILLQTVPSHVNVENIIAELEQMEGIYGVHECHIWQLAGNRIVASAHIRCHGIEEYMNLASRIKDLFHKAGIHSTTIQPEFIDWPEVASEHQPCALLCSSVEEICRKDTCCGDKDRRKMRGSVSSRGDMATHSDELNNINNSNGQLQGAVSGTSTASKPGANFSSMPSLDFKFSPDGDEVVLEMSDMMKAVIEVGEEEAGSRENLSSSENKMAPPTTSHVLSP